MLSKCSGYSFLNEFLLDCELRLTDNVTWEGSSGFNHCTLNVNTFFVFPNKGNRDDLWCDNLQQHKQPDTRRCWDVATTSCVQWRCTICPARGPFHCANADAARPGIHWNKSTGKFTSRQTLAFKFTPPVKIKTQRVLKKGTLPVLRSTLNQWKYLFKQNTSYTDISHISSVHEVLNCTS